MKRSGTTLPPTHQIVMDVKLDLLNLYDNQVVDVSKRLDLLHERIHLLDQLEGKDTDSRLKGFLLFRLHNLLVVKAAQSLQSSNVTQGDMMDIGSELSRCLSECARILMDDQGCPPQLKDTIVAFSRALHNVK